MLYEGIDVNTAQRAEPKTVPAPIGGLNGRDALAAMDATDAYQMDNVWPSTTMCKVRGGCVVYREPLGHPVFSLDVFSDGSGPDTILALGAGDLHNLDTEPPVNVKSGIDGRETVSTMFATVSDHAQWLITTTEGEDTPWSYDGAVTADLVFTGLNEASELLDNVCSYMGRLFWATRGKLGFYYLAPGAIQGAMEWFDLGQLARQGGYLKAIATYSDDAGDGPNDYIVFITSKGEYIMYQGLDPGDATAWNLVGRYKSAPPIGRKCLLDYAGDLVVLTLEGALQFSQIRKLADTRFELEALTSKLGDILLSHNVYRDQYGWSMVLYPRGGMLVVSVPHSFNEDGRHHHFVMNTTTQSWMRIDSDEWDGLCWCIANDNLYFGRYDGTVRQGDEGLSDNGVSIKYAVKQAYNYFDTMQYKHFKWSAYLIKSEVPASIRASMSVDYKEIKPVSAIGNLDPGPGAEWDVSFWDEDFWGAGPYTQRYIQPVGVYGVVGSNWLSGAIIGATLEWYATETVFEKAQGLLG